MPIKCLISTRLGRPVQAKGPDDHTVETIRYKKQSRRLCGVECSTEEFEMASVVAQPEFHEMSLIKISTSCSHMTTCMHTY